MENQVFYSNIGRFNSAIKLLKFIGFGAQRNAQTNKIEYKYEKDLEKAEGVIL